ncbi:FAD-dependent oxidoreductase [Leuconostoc sp. MS02]|uniref:FAD-dependent oxidoreductase n=4 Tax=Leuconostoc TaxID=1243 RepID=A0ABV3S8I5_9LACO|nr:MULTISPECIES: FAD-dependent oxidoreductase [Leuconostoc]ADG39504.1 probable pyridine nucleotide-disulfide oxidoreductase [Leuconostoc kimchii IMSNU 11154]AFT82521.1 putative pyridine nucleotide-disulfide oxidoreductase [Leuconostoc carnosum JB16]KAA8325657.1 pyridine nucleotide-disulfide oxidoreductase [Leuconostoc carnosum]KAA8368298.1 pyridine nucleotide-disulfide oxidoreductase [Leuconostoc carnosum]MBZ5970143.1 FAD-dependent oxidoreductase [Leuconostoc gasicomitatum]
MKHFSNIIIGFGKAGKTLAGTLAKHGEEVLVIEKDPNMYGGTCINIACLPTKNMIINAHRGIRYEAALKKKNDLTAKLRNKNYHKVADLSGVTVLTATAEFLDDHTLQVSDNSGQETLQADRIFINTGATPVWPNIDGLLNSKKVYSSTDLLAKDKQLKELVILGSGPIGLEFASMYTQFGSHVTIVDKAPKILGKFEPEVAQQAKHDLEEDGISFLLESHITNVNDTLNGVTLTISTPEGMKEIQADGLLVATGRRANVTDLHLERTSIKTGSHGEILVNDVLETNAKDVYALGDVTGGPQFTYISLDDWRIIANNLYGNKTRSRLNRPVFANTIFLNPAISSIGRTEEQLREAGIDYTVLKISAASVPKAQVIGNPRSIYKALIDPQSHQILGTTIYAEESFETINIISLAMQNHLPAEALRDQIYTHPTMTEALNDLFDQI